MAVKPGWILGDLEGRRCGLLRRPTQCRGRLARRLDAGAGLFDRDLRQAGCAQRKAHGRTLSAVSHQTLDCAHELGGAFFGAFIAAADDAVRGVVLEEGQGDLVQRRLNRGHLGDDVDAVTLVLDHPLDASDLAFDAVQPLDQVVLVLIADRVARILVSRHEPSLRARQP